MRWLGAAFAALVAAAALVGVGRWEAHRHAASENRRLAAVRALVGPLDNPTLDAYRSLPMFDCLLYKRGRNPFAIELCVDRAGRLVEAIDRRGGEPRIASLREQPGAATVRVDHAHVVRLIRRMKASA